MSPKRKTNGAAEKNEVGSTKTTEEMILALVEFKQTEEGVIYTRARR